MVFVNAGEMYCGKLEEKGKTFKNMLDTNMYHMMMMHKFFLPHLLRRTAKIQDKHCALIGFASASGARYFPSGLNCYAASKSFSRNLNMAMIAEVRDLDGTVMPGGAKSELLDM